MSFMIEFFKSMKSVFANQSPSSTSMPDSLKSVNMITGSGSSRLQGFALAIAVRIPWIRERSCP